MEWENSYYEVKNNRCEMSDKVSAFNFLDMADLSEMDRTLVFPGMNYSEGKWKKTLLIQMKDDLKKFVGRLLQVRLVEKQLRLRINLLLIRKISRKF